jgi:hypothetical protein
MTTPYTSPNDPTPFDPNATSSGGSASLPASIAAPDLSMYWAIAPDIIPTADLAPPGNGSDGQSQSAQGPSAVGIYFDSIRGSEQNMLDASATIVNAYEDLKSHFESVKDTVFGQQATVKQYENTDDSSDGVTTKNSVTAPDPIQSTAQKFANGSDGNPGMNAVQTYALEQIGDAMAIVGEFIATMNAAARQYAEADVQSFMPELPPAGSPDDPALHAETVAHALPLMARNTTEPATLRHPTEPATLRHP